MSDDIVQRARAALEGVDGGPWRVIGFGNIQSAATRPRVAKVTSAANATFVAQARSLVPDLVAEIEKLRAEMQRALDEGDWA